MSPHVLHTRPSRLFPTLTKILIELAVIEVFFAAWPLHGLSKQRPGQQALRRTRGTLRCRLRKALRAQADLQLPDSLTETHVNCWVICECFRKDAPPAKHSPLKRSKTNFIVLVRQHQECLPVDLSLSEGELKVCENVGQGHTCLRGNNPVGTSEHRKC